MKTINATTKKGKYFIWRYNNAKAQTLEERYKKPSSKKVKAFNHCALLCEVENGEGFKVISAAAHFFSVAWRVAEGLRVETAFNSYLIKF